MYGIVNKAIQDLVSESFGNETWSAVMERSGLDIDFFISNEPYDDDVTYRLAAAVSEETGLLLSEVFCAFGEWWVLRTSKEKYGGLMESGGSNLCEFLVNLPMFHNRIMLIYPRLTPPEFKISDLQERSISIHYFSQRVGLQDFVRGLLIGLGKMYHTPVTVTLLESRDAGASHDVFSVVW